MSRSSRVPFSQPSLPPLRKSLSPWASKFHKDKVFILVVKRNSIGSPAVEGGDFLGSQDDVLSGVKFGVIISQTSNPGKQT